MTPHSLNTYGVYILYKENLPIYVGSSYRLRDRLTSHPHRKVFDSYRIIPCTLRQMQRVEQKYIEDLNPPLNKGPAGNREGLIHKLQLQRKIYRNWLKECKEQDRKRIERNKMRRKTYKSAKGVKA